MKVERCSISKYPKIAKEIQKLRLRGYSLRFIRDIIFQQFGKRFSHETLRGYLDNYHATILSISGLNHDLQEEAKSYWKLLDESFTRISKITDNLMDTIEELQKKLSPEDYLKQAPKIILVCHEVLHQLEFIQREQSKVIINQKIESPLDIMKKINQSIPNYLIELEEQGRITIHDKTLKNPINCQ